MFNICKGCGIRYQQPKGPITVYCSIYCFNRQRQGKHKADMTRICARCGKTFERMPGQTKRKYCSMGCRTAPPKPKKGPRGFTGAGPDARGWKDGRSPKFYRQFLKQTCERCSSDRFLLIHHRDGNRRNSAPDNLETLCKRCHQFEHGLTHDALGRFTRSGMAIPR